jgi:hypothetical protein
MYINDIKSSGSPTPTPTSTSTSTPTISDADAKALRKDEDYLTAWGVIWDSARLGLHIAKTARDRLKQASRASGLTSAPSRDHIRFEPRDLFGDYQSTRKTVKNEYQQARLLASTVEESALKLRSIFNETPDPMAPDMTKQARASEIVRLILQRDSDLEKVSGVTYTAGVKLGHPKTMFGTLPSTRDWEYNELVLANVTAIQRREFASPTTIHNDTLDGVRLAVENRAKVSHVSADALSVLTGMTGQTDEKDSVKEGEKF